ncbi:MAG: biopolymer transporter ExbD [Sedimentisphaerales bacterium]|nr:biopolymer transporter ExbD [Sedimentisphaerales bacterium]
MKVHHSKHLKRSDFASIVALITIGLIFPFVMCYAKEVDKQQGDMINKPTTDTSESLQLVNMEKRFIIDMKKDGEIWIENEKVDIDSIKSRIENFMNEYPDGNVIITCDKAHLNNGAISEVIEQLRVAKVKNVVVATEKNLIKDKTQKHQVIKKRGTSLIFKIS